MSIEAINPLDDTARIREHRAIEAEGERSERAETPIDAMTDAELAIVVLHDPEMATRRKALYTLRIREFTAGVKSAAQTIDAVMGLYK